MSFSSRRKTITGSSVVAIGAALLFAFQWRASAHDIPNDVAVHAFLKPEDASIRLLVRIPLRACRDIDFPTSGPGYLDIARADRSLADAAFQWISDNVELYEEDSKLGAPMLVSARVSLESDRSFESYEGAIANVTGDRLPHETILYWNQALLDALFEYPIESAESRFSIRPAFAGLGLRVLTVLRFLPPGGAVRAFEFQGDPGLVKLDPRWHQAALRFVESGFAHILSGEDHLLFLFCLVIPFRRIRQLVVIVTGFTLAHSVTLIASAYNLGPDSLWFPPLVETLIAASILYMALENIIGRRVKHRWVLAFGFGLVHGFGFSFALRETLQFAGSHLLTSLLSFNVGVELGQLLVLLLLIPAIELLFKFVVAERMGIIILSALVAHTGWHWMIERGSQLAQFGWPAFDTATLVSGMRWLMVLVLVTGMIWLLRVFLSRKARLQARAGNGQAEVAQTVSAQATKKDTGEAMALHQAERSQSK